MRCMFTPWTGASPRSGLTLLLLAAVSRRLVSTPVTPAMVVVAVGVLVGPLVLDDLTLGPTSSTVRRLAEATLAVVLFSDASRIDMRALRREAVVARAAARHRPAADDRAGSAGCPRPVRLVLAQRGTDPRRDPRAHRRGARERRRDGHAASATGASVAQRRERPQRRDLRPVAADRSRDRLGRRRRAHPLHVVGEEIGYGLLGGIAAGLLAAAIVTLAGRRGLIDDAWRQIIPVAAAALAYGIAIGLGGSGFIAAFVAGILFGAIARENAPE